MALFFAITGVVTFAVSAAFMGQRRAWTWWILLALLGLQASGVVASGVAAKVLERLSWSGAAVLSAYPLLGVALLRELYKSGGDASGETHGRRRRPERGARRFQRQLTRDP